MLVDEREEESRGKKSCCFIKALLRESRPYSFLRLLTLAFQIRHGWRAKRWGFEKNSNPAPIAKYWRWCGCCPYLEAGRFSSSFCCSRLCFPEEDTRTPEARWSRWIGEGRCSSLDQRAERWVLDETDNTKPCYSKWSRGSWPKEKGTVTWKRGWASDPLGFITSSLKYKHTNTGCADETVPACINSSSNDLF